VLLFVQFPDLMAKVAEALTSHKIKYLEIRGTNSQKSGALAKFQDDGAIEKVLLLNVGDESASGACV
jgi:SNF2 family DNA or RNA helicase